MHSMCARLIASLLCILAGTACAGEFQKLKAAARNDTIAKYNLAVAYEAGEGTRQDPVAAFRLYEEAADLGLPDAQNNLAAMYFHGKGTPQDFEKAFQWFTVAAWFGFPNAARNRDVVAKRLSAESLERARHMAAEVIDRLEALPHGIALLRVAPNYPARAFNKGQTGSVQMQFTITETGTVKDIQVLKSEPPDVFDGCAIQALSQWRFAVLMRDGVPVERTGRTVNINFNLD